jgi:protein-L-isoaspartate O-methyltransferase
MGEQQPLLGVGATGVRLIWGDTLQVLPTLAADSVDAIVTDPPYGLAFMGKEFDKLGLGVAQQEWHRQWAVEALRVLKPGGHLIAFGGDRTHHRLMVAVEDAGFEIRTCLYWCFGSGFPKSLDVGKALDRMAGAEREVVVANKNADRYPNGPGGVGFHGGVGEYTQTLRPPTPLTAPATEAAQQWDGWGTALKPAVEIAVLARKPLGEGTVARNVLRHGTGAINVDGCRVSALIGQRPGVTLTAWEQEKNLCDSCASLAESLAKHGTLATRGTSVESPAGLTTNGKGENAHADTGTEDTGCSAGPFLEGLATDLIGDSSLSTVEFGKMPTVQSRKATKSTTSTAKGSTTGLRICNACGCLITDLGIIGSTPASKNGTLNTPAAQGIAAPVGRWPTHFLHDGSPEVQACFPETTSGELKAGTIRNCENKVYGKGMSAAGKPATLYDTGGDSGSAARFFPTFPPTETDRACAQEDRRLFYTSKAGRADREFGNTHATVKPLELMRWLVRLVTTPNGTVLDPFTGSGSTGRACAAEGFQFVGIERERAYAEIAQRRLLVSQLEVGLGGRMEDEPETRDAETEEA